MTITSSSHSLTVRHINIPHIWECFPTIPHVLPLYRLSVSNRAQKLPINNTMANNKLKLSPQITRSKPMDYRYVEYEYAQYFVQKIGIKSTREYWKWYTEYRPAGFPFRPERTYHDCWTDWNEFLGGDNCYQADHPSAVREKDRIPYWEAVNLIQPMKLKTAEEYRQAFDNGDIPKGIPRNPHWRYSVFYAYGGYKTFLGKEAKHRIQAAANIDPLFVVYQSGSQPNVLSVTVHTKGAGLLMKEIREQGIKVVKVYHWYPEFAEHVYSMINHFGTKQSDNTWLFGNVNEILFELGSVLEPYVSG